jgi:hypothetical protein
VSKEKTEVTTPHKCALTMTVRTQVPARRPGTRRLHRLSPACGWLGKEHAAMLRLLQRFIAQMDGQAAHEIVFSFIITSQ